MTALLRSPLLSRVVPRHGWLREPPRGGRISGGAVWLPRQVHGSEIVVVESARDPVAAADGGISTTPDVGVGVVAADCVPLLLASEDGLAVAAVHVGWRGLAAGIVEAAVARLTQLGRHGAILAGTGPAASGCCYEVGPEVLSQVQPSAPHRLAVPDEPRRIDLRLLVAERLERAGVGRARCERVGPCTICSGSWPSYRRDGESAGRLVAFVFPAHSS